MFDANVVLDVLLRRRPFAEPAGQLLSRAERGDVQGYICASVVTTVFYLARKAAGLDAAHSQVRTILSILDVAPVTGAVLREAAESDMSDFDDAVVAASARAVRVDAIATRNERDFAKAPVSVYSPASLLVLLDASAKQRSRGGRRIGDQPPETDCEKTA